MDVQVSAVERVQLAPSPSWSARARSLLAPHVAAVVRYRRPIVVAVHLLLMTAANYLAFWLRFDGVLPLAQRTLFIRALPWLLLIRATTFVPFRLYQGLWRYAGLWELQRIVGATAVSSAICYSLALMQPSFNGYPPSIIIIDSILLICLAGGVRLFGRLQSRPSVARGQRRVLIVGAGDAGETIVRNMQRRQILEPVGFVDDDLSKVGQRIHGVRVLGTRANLPALIRQHRPEEVLIAVPSAEPVMVQEIVQALRAFSVRITTLPTQKDIVHGTPVTQIRDVSIEDLLARAPVDLDRRSLKRLIAGRSVMVTGAGGSIGSELCRQIAALRPASLVLYERYENNLFAIGMDLHDRGASDFVHPVVGDVTDATRLDAVMADYRPEIVFHAAAHKHVPLMEQNPCEAVKNNVTGTRLLAEAAERHGVRRLIFISTDKAVNPTSVMGATKRIAELILLTFRDSATSFSTVRFGNVLGSNGSVVPRFLQQIRAGGPVTITHPEIRRFFMLIPEAVQLVLHAAARKAPGMVYVLEMGEQIKLVEMARNLITLSGFVPDEEIPITFIGLRPGEKLFEELVGPDEEVQAASGEKILQVSPRTLPDPGPLRREFAKLEHLARSGDAAAVLTQIGVIVPEFSAPETELTTAAPPIVQVEAPSPDESGPRLRRAAAARPREIQRGAPPPTAWPDLRSLDLVVKARSALRRPFSPSDLR